MRGVRIPHDLNGEDQFVLGLSVTRLAALLLGLLAAYTILHLALPAPLQLSAAGMAALAGAAIAWVRPEGRSLIHWALAAVEFKFGQQIAPDPQSSHRTDPKTRTPNRKLISDRGPRLSVVTHTQSTPTHELPPAAPVQFADDDVIELPEPGDGAGQHADADIDVETPEPAPVYLGGPQVITFFSAKGGTGRTTLATEVAALLAMKGRYRESPTSPPQHLRVVLIDFDLASANVSARLGIAQPTMLDYLCDLTVPHPDPRDYLVHHHATGLDVLLGPSKCLAGDRAELFGVPQAAHILSTLKAAGYQFLILDMSATLGNLETYLLETATRIYCVVTPTAGSVQSLYRGVEALRRLGLGPKLQYVANKMRDGFNLAEPMGDLNGSLVARIPYDPGFDTAENRHEPIVIRSAGASGDALRRLAASVYPALQLPAPSRSRLRSLPGCRGAAVLAEAAPPAQLPSPEELRHFVRAQLTLQVDPEILDPFSANPNRNTILRDRIRDAITQRHLTPTSDLVDCMFDEIVGLGPLQPLMADPEISDILVNRFDEIYIERRGRLEFVSNAFRDEAQLEQVIQKIVALVGREINIEKPLVDARMVDGSRANAVYAPVGGPTLCIRKFNRVRLALLPDEHDSTQASWASSGGLSLQMGAFLEAMAIARANILIAGATGSGKSTLLRSIVSAFPPEERVITIEDTAELELDNPHWVKLECVHSRELAGKTTQDRRLDVADLVQNALRMRPDRLIIGEIRHSKEAYYVLEALNTGHDGSATTIHASSCADALARLELLISRDFAQLGPPEIRRYIARVFDLVVFVGRLRDGRRCVQEIAELRDVDANGRYELCSVFASEQTTGRHGIDVDFSAVPDYRPGPRLVRKLGLQGMRWMS